MRVWKVGTPCLATVVTFRLPEAGGGEGWSWRGRGGSGSGGGGVGGGGPSTLRVWKDGTPCLAMVVTFCLPEAGGGEGWSWRGRGGSGGTLVAASPREAWWAAARRLRRALARAPRRRWRRPGVEEVVGDADGGAAVVGISSLTLVLPLEVDRDSVACPPAFSILWKASNKIVSSSPIFLQNLNQLEVVRAQIQCSQLDGLTFKYMKALNYIKACTGIILT